MLTRFLGILLGMTALLTLSGPAAAAIPEVRIGITPAGEGIRVVYDLSAPVSSLPLRIKRGPFPASTIRAEGEGFSFERGEVKAERPFTRATLLVMPDRKEVGSVYPLLLPVRGKGFVLYAPYLLPAEAGGRTGLTVGGGARTLRGDALNGYVIVGSVPEREKGYRALVADGTPPLLRETMLGRAGRLLAFYRSRLGRPAGGPPVIILSFSEGGQGAQSNLFRGDVTANNIVFLRVHAGAAQAGEAAMVARYTAFLSHELFHLWNRSGDPASGNWWLHEGGAEYASWLATSNLWPAEARLEERVGGALTTCAMYLWGRPLSSLSELEAGSVRYACGAVIQWIADAGLRSEAGERDIFAIWSRLLAVRRSRGSYRPADFRSAVAALAPRALAPLEAILDGSGIERWGNIAQSLNAMGARVEAGPPAPFLLRLAAARALVLSACGEVHGVGDGDKGLFVQAPESCAAFANSPVIEQAGGIAPMADAAAFYEAVRSRCGEGGEIVLTLNAGGVSRTQRVRCTSAVEAPPPDLKVVRALPRT